jgi:nucleoside-diphosphate-sugar epimerase
VGEEPALTERAWVEQIAAAAGWRGEVAVVPDDRLPEPLRQPFDWRYELATDTRRLREDLGYVEPVPMEEALARTAAWERSQPADGGPPDYAAEDAVLAAAQAPTR